VNGASADPRYNLTYIVDQSVKENKPFVAVSINYRLSYWGFLFSEEMEAAGAGNIAFKDQRLAFKWIQDNVAAFGGSADKVTVWGESAGARALGMQLIAYDGQFDNLFRGAIMESGSPVTKFVDAAAWQPYFNSVVEKTGCSNSTDHLECLRELPVQTLNDVFNGTTPVNVTSPSLSAVLDGDFITAQAPELLAAGKFAHVPLLLGNNFDEGTAYGKKGLNTSDQFATYLSGLNLTDAQVDKIAALYPDNPDVGIPASYVGRPTDPAYGPQWKRAAAFAGDWQQHAGRRLLAESYVQAGLSVYSYLWNVYVNGISNILGATHFQEVAFVFYDTTSSEFENKPETFKELSNLMSRQWVNFINDADPNLSISPNADTPRWPLYTLEQPDNIVFDVNVTGLAYTAEDNYRDEAIAYLQQNVYK
jgi:acetylcholinesterase